MNLAQNLGAAILIVFVLSILYYLIPARRLSGEKPVVAIFPKYWIPIENGDRFRQALIEAKFIEKGPELFVRGSYFGDLFLSWAKLKVSLSEDHKKAIIGSGFMVIAFDTGDLWKLCKTLEVS